MGGVVAVINIATTAVTMFVSSILAPGPTTPAPPMMLFVVLGWAQRELQRTFLNQNPTAVVDAIDTAEDDPVDIEVLANDTDPDINTGANPFPGDRLTVTDYTQPTSGSVVLNGNGTFTYTPNPDFNGTDSFSYTVSDEASPWHLHGLAGFFGGGGHSSTTTVNITVTPVEDNTAPPTADNDTATVNEAGSVAIDVLDGDTDPDNNIDPATVEIVTDPANGSLVVDPTTGVVTYQSNGAEVTSDSFTYNVKDTGGLTSNTATVNITVTPVNDGPPIADNDTATVNEAGSVNIDVLDGDTDPDGDATIDPTTVEIVTDPASGSAVVDPVTGAVTYQSNGAEVTSDSFTYRVKDATGAYSNTATVNITVTPVNDGPPIADNDTATVNEAGSVNIDVLDGDTDPDGDATIDPTTVEIVTDPASGSAVVDPVTGAVTYQSNGAEVTTDSFTYRVKDATGAYSNTATVNITVTPVNDPPVADNDTATVAEGSSLAIDVLDGDTDADNTIDPTTVDIVAGPAHGSTVVNPTTGVITYQSNGDEVTSDSFTYRVKDATGAWSNTATVSINITPVDQPFDTATLDVDGSPTDIVITPDGKRAYIGNIPGNTLTVLDVDPNSPTYNQVLDLNAGVTGVQGINVGAGPHTLAVTPDGKRLYVTHYANQGGTTVTVVNIDTTSASYGQVIDTNAADGGVQKITVGSFPAGIAITPDGKRAYVANSNSASISVIDTDPNSPTYNQVLDAETTTTAVDSIAVPDGPFKVAVSADGKRIYVTSLTANRVSVIDIDPTSLNYHKVIDTDAIAPGTDSIVVGGSPEGIAITPGINGARAYVVNPGLDTVSVIDVDPNSPTYNQVLDQNPAIAGVQGIPVGDNPTRIAISRDGKYAVVTNLLSDNVSVIDINRNSATYNKVVDVNPSTAVIENVAVGDSPDGIAITPDGTRAYVTKNSDGTIRMIQLPADATVPSFDVYNVGGTPIDSAVVGQYLYAPALSSNTVTVVDLNTNTEVDTDPAIAGDQGITVESGPAGIARVGRFLYVSNFGSDSVSVIDTLTNTVVDTDSVAPGIQHIGVGAGPNYMVAVGDKVYVANQYSQTVTVIDTLTNTRVDVDPVIAGPQDLPVGNFGIASVGDRVYVANYSDDTVSVIDTVTDTVVDIDSVTPGLQQITGAGMNDPRGVAVVGNKLYAANGNATVSVIDLTDYSAVDTDPDVSGTQPISIPASGGPLFEMAVNGDRLYVADGSGGVVVIDTTTDTYIETIPAGSSTWGLNIVGNYLYATNLDGTVTAIDITPTVL